ncbi:MAG: hypothetical protein QN160_10085 [Armatimonadota bacterium]|nr:hypothetical protein [Armatimonadota bacterium]
MSLEVRLPEMEQKEQKKRIRIKPAGWLAIAVVSLFLLSLIGLGARELYWTTRGLEALPTLPPPPTRTPTPSPVPPTPTPQGWSRAWDPVTKQEYLVPPPGVETQIREAFNAVLGWVVVDNADPKMLLAYKRPEVRPVDRPFIDPVSRRPAVDIRKLGPETIRCPDYETCTISRAATGFYGYVVFEEKFCRKFGSPSVPCIIAPPQASTSDPHGLVHFATFKKKEDGQWVIIDWRVESLPPLPPSPSP